MAPVALQGYWIFKARHKERRDDSIFEIEDYLIDTCRVWRKDGPLVAELKKG